MAPTEFLSVLPYVAAAGVFAGLYLLRRHVRGQDCRSDARLDGKTAIVTGANSGIGRAAAQELAARGARVILACRDMTKAETAASDIRQATGNGNVVAGKLDLASLASVREFADHVNREEERLDILINNAGVMWCPQQYTADGFELQFGVNHLGHFLLTHLLLDLLTRSAPSRVVTVSAVGHAHANIDFDNLNGEKSYSPFQANFQSKLANALFSRELARRTREQAGQRAVLPGASQEDNRYGCGGVLPGPRPCTDGHCPAHARHTRLGPVRAFLTQCYVSRRHRRDSVLTQCYVSRRYGRDGALPRPRPCTDGHCPAHAPDAWPGPVIYQCYMFTLGTGTGVTALSLDPGPVRTDIARHMPRRLARSCYIPYMARDAAHPAHREDPPPRRTDHRALPAVAEGLEECSGMYFSNCAPTEPASQAKDDAVALRLWEVSEAMVGIRS
uniref:Uncharacterized protein n=1 Tax=Branchiostoma floridae TaxID=7739 RepID=C3ZIX0_BRAFL|eukprot:XP_002591475.1 hypothetical protein BRAFLDRAFT_105245 [Branchiostoma floridae]